MKSKFSYIFFLLIITSTFLKSQGFKEKEFLKYRVHYGLLNAGFATLEVKEQKYNGKPHYHIIGKGSSSGAVRAFFKVDDRYETYIDKATKKPSKFVRKISEGGYTKDKILTFDHNSKVVTVNDRKKKKVTFHYYKGEVQDMLSAFYYLRSMNKNSLRKGATLGVDIFMDEETFPFKLKVLGTEKVKTKFGKIDCIKLVPYVQSGRIFKTDESVVMWVTNDDNLIPISLKAELAVGSLKMDLHDYKNVKYPLNFK